MHGLILSSKSILYPMVMGSTDRSIINWPVVPAPVMYLVHYVFEWKYAGAWRFSPSTSWGKKRQLAFTGKNWECFGFEVSVWYAFPWSLVDRYEWFGVFGFLALMGTSFIMSAYSNWSGLLQCFVRVLDSSKNFSVFCQRFVPSLS